jgi:predicted nucleic acid-binding Zn ribbon protein
MEIAHTHDTHLFSAMINLLVTSGRGEKDYGFKKNSLQTRYDEVTSVLNQQGYSNRAGKLLNRNAMKQVVHRVRGKPEVLDTFRPDWSDFEFTEVSETTHADACLVCGTGVPRENRKTCSFECGGIYQQHKDTPCDRKFPSIFHQIRYEEKLIKINDYQT